MIADLATVGDLDAVAVAADLARAAGSDVAVTSDLAGYGGAESRALEGERAGGNNVRVFGYYGNGDGRGGGEDSVGNEGDGCGYGYPSGDFAGDGVGAGFYADWDLERRGDDVCSRR